MRTFYTLVNHQHEQGEDMPNYEYCKVFKCLNPFSNQLEKPASNSKCKTPVLFTPEFVVLFFFFNKIM